MTGRYLDAEKTGLLQEKIIQAENELVGDKGSKTIFKYLAEHISKNCYLNIMDQYRPCGRALDIPGMGETITVEQYQQAITSAKENGLTRLDQREMVLLYEKLIIKE